MNSKFPWLPLYGKVSGSRREIKITKKKRMNSNVFFLLFPSESHEWDLKFWRPRVPRVEIFILRDAVKEWKTFADFAYRSRRHRETAPLFSSIAKVGDAAVATARFGRLVTKFSLSFSRALHTFHAVWLGLLCRQRTNGPVAWCVYSKRPSLLCPQ